MLQNEVAAYHTETILNDPHYAFGWEIGFSYLELVCRVATGDIIDPATFSSKNYKYGVMKFLRTLVTLSFY